MPPPASNLAADDASRLAVVETRIEEHERRLDEGKQRMETLDTKIDKLLWLQLSALLASVGGLCLFILDHYAK